MSTVQVSQESVSHLFVGQSFLTCSESQLQRSAKKIAALLANWLQHIEIAPKHARFINMESAWVLLWIDSNTSGRNIVFQHANLTIIILIIYTWVSLTFILEGTWSANISVYKNVAGSRKFYSVASSTGWRNPFGRSWIEPCWKNKCAARRNASICIYSISCRCWRCSWIIPWIICTANIALVMLTVLLFAQNIQLFQSFRTPGEPVN